jgi:hypothetical protein
VLLWTKENLGDNLQQKEYLQKEQYYMRLRLCRQEHNQVSDPLHLHKQEQQVNDPLHLLHLHKQEQRANDPLHLHKQ